MCIRDSLKATVNKVQLNWPAPAYIGLLVLFAGHIDRLTAGWRRLVVAGMASSVVLLAITFFPALIGLSLAKAPFKDLRLWEKPVQIVARQVGDVHFLMVPNYHLAGEIAFYWPQRLPIYLVAESRRFSQHDFWPGIGREVGRDGVYVATRNEKMCIRDSSRKTRRPSVAAMVTAVTAKSVPQSMA